jgi:hypothetical protein
LTASVCLLTAYDSNYRALAALAVPSMARLSQAHGYALRALTRDGAARRGGWIKIEPIREALSESFDYILWIDIDTIVARTDLDIRNIMQSSVELHMAWHDPGLQTPDPPHFNSGVMLIRASDWTRAFFARVWEHGPLPHRWNDQATIHHLLGYDAIAGLGPDRTEVIADNPVAFLNHTWNTIPRIAGIAEPVIWHFAGMPNERRLALMEAASKGGSPLEMT